MLKISSFKHAISGILLTITKHPNIRFHLLAGSLAILLSWFLKLTRVEFIMILFVIVLVITTEMINTAVESMVDLITLEYRKEAKIAKDIAAGMVLINSILAMIVGLIIYWPHLQSLLHF
ncbi:diacylglycerol kinase family protein [Pseudomonadota bacterium]